VNSSEHDPFGPTAHETVRLDIEKFSARLDLGSRVFHQSNVGVEANLSRGIAELVAKALSRDTAVETTTREFETKTTEANREYRVECHGPVPAGIIDHLKLAIYGPVARYIRWAKGEERYRNDGGRPYGVAFCCWLVRRLRPRRFRRLVNHAVTVFNDVRLRHVQDIHIHRHICPHIPATHHQTHVAFLCGPDRGKHYLVAFARELVEWAEGKDSSLYGCFDRGGNVLGYAKSLRKEYQ
jgi:hypothetical protein